MTLNEIKDAVSQGKTVYWKTLLYPVIKDSSGEYFIKCTKTNHLIGLTWADNKTLNGKESDFFISISTGFATSN